MLKINRHNFNILQNKQCIYHIIKKTISIQPHTFAEWYRSLWQPSLKEPPFEHVTQIGDPVLRQKAMLVPSEDITSKEIKYLIKLMTNVLRKHDCVGLSAPQIGINLRVILMEFRSSIKDEFTIEEYRNRQMSTLPLTVFINPQIIITNYNKITFLESCASVTGYTGAVTRYEECELKGFDENGNNNTLKLKGWNARIAQHEMDHLEGIVYTDIMDRKTFNCTNWEAVNQYAGKIKIPFIPKKKNKLK